MSQYSPVLQKLKSTINARDLIIFCQKNNIVILKVFIFCVLRTLTFMQQSKERETRENEKGKKETKKLHKSPE